jgi:hypothetical protein
MISEVFAHTAAYAKVEAHIPGEMKPVYVLIADQG